MADIQHTRKPLRLTHYNYSTAGFYFVTICTKDRACMFGSIEEGTMHLNAAGLLAREEWTKTLTYLKGVELDVFVVMPNHLHAILIIKEQAYTLGDIIGHYKSRASKGIRKAGFMGFAWQRLYHDRVIRGEKDLERIREYIVNNRLKWEDNEENVR